MCLTYTRGISNVFSFYLTYSQKDLPILPSYPELLTNDMYPCTVSHINTFELGFLSLSVILFSCSYPRVGYGNVGLKAGKTWVYPVDFKWYE